MVEPLRDARQVAHTIAVRILERAWVDLVHDAGLPPRSSRGDGHAVERYQHGTRGAPAPRNEARRMNRSTDRASVAHRARPLERKWGILVASAGHRRRRHD